MNSTGNHSDVWLETLLLISQDMGPNCPFQTSLTSLLRKLSEHLDFLRPHLVLFDPETGLLRLSLAEAQPRSNHANYAPGVGVTGHVFATGKPVIVPKMKGDPLFLSLLFERSEQELEELSFISVPILSPSGKDSMSVREVIGTLNADTRFISRDDLEKRRLFLEAAASLIANQAAFMRESLNRQWQSTLFHPKLDMEGRHQEFHFVFRSKAMSCVLEQARQMLSGHAPVLISGEPGVGKETLAAWMHKAGQRRNDAFLACHCTTLASEKALTELCGFQKNALLGAMHTQKGIFEQANLGTVYLDAVDALPQEAQEALLLLVKEQKVLRKGAAEAVPVNVRVIASTRRSLTELSRKGLFLNDLCARFCVNEIHVPPLRERCEDIVPLSEHFLRKFAADNSAALKSISSGALELLVKYFWPGNITELESCLLHAVKTSEAPLINISDLPFSLQAAESYVADADFSLNDAIIRFEKKLLIDSLIKSGGNMLKASRMLKTSYRIINYKVKKYGITPHQFSRKSKEKEQQA